MCWIVAQIDNLFIDQNNQNKLVVLTNFLVKLKRPISNWLSQMHPNDQFFFFILTSLFLQCVASSLDLQNYYYWTVNGIVEILCVAYLALYNFETYVHNHAVKKI
jgi:hypothetical protein